MDFTVNVFDVVYCILIIAIIVIIVCIYHKYKNTVRQRITDVMNVINTIYTVCNKLKDVANIDFKHIAKQVDSIEGKITDIANKLK